MKNHSVIYKLLTAAWGFVLALSVVSCRQEDDFGRAQGADGYMTLQLACSDMLPTYYDPMDEILGTRAATQKNDDEKQIRTLHLFFFQENGEFADLKEPDDNINAPYVRFYPGTTEQTIKIPKDCFIQTNLTVVALANIQGDDPQKTALFKTPSTQSEIDGESFVMTLDESEKKEGYGSFTKIPFEVNRLSDLQKWVYAPAERERVRDLPVGGMPMMSDPVIIENTDQASLQRITMKSMMARVEVNIRLEPNQTSRDGLLPILTINEYGVKNMAATVPYIQPDLTDLGYGNIREEKTIEDPHQVAANSTGPDQVISLVYYTYENIQGVNPKDGYPDGVDTPEEMQRWKPIAAKEHEIDEKATAIVIRGEYQTHQGFTYKAAFSIYLGGNTIDDFSVKRNHCYTNNIVISGLDYVRNDDDGVYTFDGRVNVKDENNVWYISVVNERKIDSHASVLPMDIYLVLREDETNLEHPAKSTVTLKLVDETEGPNYGGTPDWIGFEMVDYPTGMIPYKVNGKFVAGTGAKNYFYHNLVSDPVDPGTGANKFNLRKEGSYTIVEHNETGAVSYSTYDVNDKEVYRQDGHITGENSRMRIYFYIDENVPKSAQSYTEPVPARHARIELVYDNSNGEHRERRIEIDQAGLLLVNTRHKQNEWTYMYIETYEEYLDHNDPLEYHTSPEIFEGLPWGQNGYTFSRGLFGYPYTDNYHGGLSLTRTAIDRLGLDVKDIYLYNQTHNLTSDDLWAVTYAYGKNKRQSSLNAGETEGEVYVNNACVGYWELPGIRDLETALVQYYSIFPDFQGKFYWSSATGKNGSYEVDTKARASKIEYIDNDNYDYAESGGQNTPGYKDRSDKTIRIRVAYKTQAQNNRTSFGQIN